MTAHTDWRAPATTFLIHFFGRGLVDEGRCYAVERFVSLSNGDIRRRPAGPPTRRGRRRPAAGRSPRSPRSARSGTCARRSTRSLSAQRWARAPGSSFGDLRSAAFLATAADAIERRRLNVPPAGRPSPSFSHSWRHYRAICGLCSAPPT